MEIITADRLRQIAGGGFCFTSGIPTVKKGVEASFATSLQVDPSQKGTSYMEILAQSGFDFKRA